MTSYTVVSASVGPYSVGFDIYADDDDYAQWIEVWDDGVKLTAVTDYTVSSVAGGADLSIIARPITDAQITFTTARSGAIKIVGARRPRQASQFINGVSITADQHNRRYTDLMAIARETWDYRTRVLAGPPGETIAVMPSAADRASKFLGFSTDGDPVAASAITGVPAIASAIENDSDVPGDSVADALNAIGDQFVDARADIASITPPASVDTIITGGFATAGDGGADVLVRSASDPGLASGFQIQDAGGVYWKRATNRTIHGKQVGVVADGATDDQPAIAAALAYIETTLSGNAALILPAGDIVASAGDITISSSNTELLGQGRATNIQLGATRTLYIDHASVEVNRSAIRNLRISRTGSTATTDVNVRFRRTRRCQITDVFFHNWSGDAVVIGDGGAGLNASATYVLRCSGLGGANSRGVVRFANSVDTGDILLSQLMFDAGGAALTGDALLIGGTGVGSVDGIMVSDCLFTAFRGGVHMDFPAGAGIGNGLFSGITFDSGIEAGASNADTFTISVSGGTINTLIVTGCKINAYHTTGTEANFRLDVSSGSVAGVLLNGNIFSSSRNEAVLISQSGGTVAGFNLIGNYLADGSRSGAGNSSAVLMSGDIDKIMIAGNTVLHGSGDNWEYGFDLSGLTGDVPYIGPNQIQNTATGHTNLAAAHSVTGLNAQFWAADGEPRFITRASANFEFTGVISPSQITANQNDYTPTGLATAAVLRLSSDASRNITGLAGGADGRILFVHNVGSFNIVLKDADANSTAANRFALTADITMAADTVIVLQYDATSSRWRAVGGTGGGSGDVTGPASSTDNAAARFDSTTGKIVQNSALIIADTTGALSRSGGGGIPVQGTNTNDNAAAGEVGEFVSSSVAQGSAVSLTTGTRADVTSISLTAGDWDVWANPHFIAAATTNITILAGSISTTSVTHGTDLGGFAKLLYGSSGVVIGPNDTGFNVGTIRLSLSATTTVYLVVSSAFTVDTLGGFGKISARRVR